MYQVPSTKYGILVVGSFFFFVQNSAFGIRYFQSRISYFNCTRYGVQSTKYGIVSRLILLVHFETNF